MTVLVDGKYYEDATYNTQFISVMNGEAVPVPNEMVQRFENLEAIVETIGGILI